MVIFLLLGNLNIPVVGAKEVETNSHAAMQDELKNDLNERSSDVSPALDEQEIVDSEVDLDSELEKSKNDQLLIDQNQDQENSNELSDNIVQNSNEESEDNLFYDLLNAQLSAVNKTELIIQPGESIRITNTTKRVKTITTDARQNNNIRYDHAGYNVSGKVLYNGFDSSGNVTIEPNGGYSVITADYGSPMTINFESEMSYTYSEVPALLKKTLNLGESFYAINQSTSSLARMILTDAKANNDKRYDFAVYTNNGSLSSYFLETSYRPYMTAGSQIIVTGASTTPVTVAFPYETFIGGDIEEPAFDAVKVNPGESYEFLNIGSKLESLRHSGGTEDKFDYVVYLPDGTEASRGSNTSSLPSVEVGRKVSITLTTNNSLRVGGPYRVFSREERPNGSITRVTLSPGESYKFINTGSLTNPINNDARQVSGKYDYTVYKSDGSYSSQGFDTIAVPSVPAGATVIITVQGNSAVTFDYTDEFIIETSSTPSHYRVTLTPGESYKFINISNRYLYLCSDATSSNRFDWVEYYQNGTQQGQLQNTYTNPKVSSNNYIVVTALTSPVTFGVNYHLFSWEKKSGEDESKLTVTQGKSYIIRNNEDKVVTLTYASGNNGVYDYVVYTQDHKIQNNRLGADTSINIPSKGYVIVTGYSITPAVFLYSHSLSVEGTINPALLSVEVKVGQWYRFTNTSNITVNLNYDSTDINSSFSYVLYRPDGSIESTESRQMNSVLVPAGYSITVSPVELPLRFGGAYTAFKGAEGNPEAGNITLNKNQSYVFENISGMNKVLYNNAPGEDSLSVDYVVYNANGKPVLDMLADYKNITVPVGGRVVVTIVSEAPVTFTYGTAFKVTESKDPAYLSVEVKVGQWYTFTNISKNTVNLNYDFSVQQNPFSYVLYRPDGSVESEGSQQIYSVLVPAGYSITVSPVEIPIRFGGAYPAFKGIEGKPEAGQITLSKNQSYVFENISSNYEVLYNNAPGDASLSFDYAVYYANGMVVLEGLEQSKNITVPMGGRVVITVVSEAPVTFTYGQAFKLTESKDPALLSVEVKAGQSYTFTNISTYTVNLNYDSSLQKSPFNYVMYRPDGTVESEESRQMCNVLVPAGYSITVSSLELSIRFGGAFTVFKGTEGNPEAGKVTLSKNQSYVFKNIRDVNKILKSDSSKENLARFDYALYSDRGIPMGRAMDNYFDTTVSAGGQIVVTVVSDTPVTFTHGDDFEVIPTDQPALVKVTLEQNQMITFKNNGPVATYLLTDAKKEANRYFDYVIEAGNTIYSGKDVDYTYVIGAGRSIELKTTSTDAIIFAAPYREFELVESN
jgi:hypothetical protein